MNESFEKLKAIYSEVYKITVEITSLLEVEDIEQSFYLLEKRGKLLSETSNLRSNSNFSEEQKAQLNEIIDKIKTLDIKNTDILIKDKIAAQDSISKVNKNNKIISAYKYNKEEIAPKLFDYKE